MKRFIFLFVLIAAFLMLSAPESFACSCGTISPTASLEQRVTEAREQAKAVFSAEVLEIEPLPGGRVVNVKLKIDKIWKRDLPGTVTIWTRSGRGGHCGFPFSVGGSYLVYAHGGDENDFLATDICSRTRSIERAEEDLKILGEGKSPGKKQDPFRISNSNKPSQ